MDILDKVYVINLLSRVDRREKWQILINYLPTLSEKLVFFPAIDGSLIENKTKLRNGELGCSMSHLAIWKEAKQKGYRFILVFEDDLIFEHDFEHKLNLLLEEIQVNFDWIYLYNTWDYRPAEPFSNQLHKIIASLGTQAYILNVASLNRILPYVEEFRFPIDVVMGHMSFLSKVYRPSSIFVDHDEQSKSNISEKLTFFAAIKAQVNKRLKKHK